MDSSSDEDTREGGWSDHLHTRTQLLSADQLELWRKVLKEEIEEDLQRQVRDRLGLDWLPICEPSSSPPQDSVYSLNRSLKQPNTQPLAVKSAHAQPPLLPPSAVVHASAAEHNESRANSSTHTQQRRTAGHVTKARTERPSHMTDHMTGHMTLQQYVHSKYGVPDDQLTHLHSMGALETRTVDTSGCGRGPLIRVPAEANILQPTPVHITTPTSDHVTASPCHATTPHGNVTTPHDHVMSHDDHTHIVPPIIGKSHPSHGHTPHSHTLHGHESHTIKTRSPHSSHAPITHTAAHSHTTHSKHNGEGGLTFEARFEGGNLHKAEQIGPFEYNIWLNFDLYSNKHTQWFYFRVEGMVTMATYVFHIVNLYKPDSLYNYGMQPLLYSQCETELGKAGWSRVGRDVKYVRTPSTKYYTLSWHMEFPHTGDVCYLAHCYPYSYSRLIKLLDTLHTQRGMYMQRESLCKTLAGNDCPLVTITDFQGSEAEVAGREGVVITARVHPGETNSSWMMEGLLHMLTADTPHAKALRSAYVFKLVPMLNPDGVVVGNYRTSLAGVDLNRVYKNTAIEMFPTVAHTKSMVDSLMAHRKVVLYVDLHGHSRKHNVFMYGCHTHQCDHTHFLKERLFPFILSQQAPRMFSFASCKYAVQRCKESTGRVVMWRRGVANSFTMEATFCGSTLGHNSQFTSDDLMEMGTQLGEAIYRHHRLSVSKSTEQRVLGQLADVIMQSALPDVVTTHTTDNGHKTARRALRRFMKFDLQQINESSTSGSDSENDEFEYRKKKVSRTKRTKHRSTLHTRTQPLLPSLPSHQLVQASHTVPQASHQSQHSSHHPMRRRKSIPATRSCAPLPSLALSAPPRLEGKGQRWKFKDKYKGRSNGGIPMFSEERLKERAEKRLHSVSMFQQSTAEAAKEESKTTGAERKARHKFPVFWQHSIGQDLALARVQRSTVPRQPSKQQPTSQESSVARQLNAVHERQWMHDLRGQLRERRSKGQLSPALAQFIKDLWSKH